MNGAPRTLGAEGTNRGAFASLDWMLFTVNGLIWGSSFLLIAIGLDAFPPSVVTFGRLLFGAVVLWCLPGARTRIDRSDWSRVALLGVIWMALPLSLFPLAEQRISSSLAGMINAATPIVAAGVAAALLRRRPGRSQLLGLLIGFGGVILISASSISEGGSSAIGTLMAFAAVCGYGVSVNLAMPLQQHYGSLAVMARAETVGVLCTAPFALAHVGQMHFRWSSFLAVLVLGAVGTGAAFAFMGVLSSRVGGARASTLTYITPAVALGLGVAFRGDRVGPAAVLGCVLVLAGAFLNSRADR